MHKDSTTLQSPNAKTAIKLDTSPKYAFKNAQTQSQQQYIGKPKQAYQIIVPEQPNTQYKSADESDDDDNSIIAYQMCA